MKSKPGNRFQPLTDHIEAMIAGGQYSAGSRIPPLRELCERFKLSRGTAARGLEFLQAQGILELRRGSGAYVRKVNSVDAGLLGRRIAVFSEHIDIKESYCAHIILGLQRQAAATGAAINLHLRKYGMTTYEVLDQAARAADALLLVGHYDIVLDRLPRIRPGVGIDMLNSYGFASLIGLDPLHCAELAEEFFLSRQMKRVKIISFPIPLYAYRAEIFARRWSARGQSETYLPLSELHANFERPELYDRIIREMQDPDCGYLFVSGTECNRTQMEYQRQTGRLLSRDRCVLSIDGKSLLIPEYLPVNTITPDYTEIGELALSECLRRIENPGARPRRILVSGSLVEMEPEPAPKRSAKSTSLSNPILPIIQENAL